MDRDSLPEASASMVGRRPTSAVRGFSAGLAIVSFLSSAGCVLPSPFTRNDFGSPLPANATVEQVVQRVNTNIGPLKAWRSSDVRISGPSMPVHLGGQIAVEQPRNFRLTAGVLGFEEADFGSNIDWFWFWVKRGAENGRPSYVYQARHEDVPNSRMLSQIPFQPDWLMEALGVVPIDAQHVTLHVEGRDYVNLISERLSPSGQTVKKVIRVDLRRGIVLSHSLYDVQGRLIAGAHLDNHFRDKATGIIMPHLIALEWPQANLRINLEMNQIEVNPANVAAGNWQIPNKAPAYPPFDIGALTRKNPQVADRRAQSGARGRVDTASAAAVDPSWMEGPPPQFGAPSPLARPSRLGSPSNNAAWPEADASHDWSQPTQAPTGSAPGRVQLEATPFVGDPAAPATKLPSSSPPGSAAAGNPFADPPPASSPQTSSRPQFPGQSSSGGNSGDPFESLPR
jgi:hypothetical protein